MTGNKVTISWWGVAGNVCMIGYLLIAVYTFGHAWNAGERYCTYTGNELGMPVMCAVSAGVTGAPLWPLYWSVQWQDTTERVTVPAPQEGTVG